MADFNEISEIVKKLHEINFNENNGIIKYRDKVPPIDAAPKLKKGNIIGCCRLCESSGNDNFEIDKKDKPNLINENFKLNNVSHGTHTVDFLSAISDVNIKEKIEEWKNDTPVLFVLENPSLDYEIYDYIGDDYNGKRPAKEWYWIHARDDWKVTFDDCCKDENLGQSKYGEMIMSLICQYELANAYVTNIVKCGLSDAKYCKEEKNNVKENEALNLIHYTNKCKRMCVENIFLKEIQALRNKKDKPVIIFAFGERPYSLLNDFLSYSETARNELAGMKYVLRQLPHPASRMKNSYRKHVLKGIVSESINCEKYKIADGKKFTIEKVKECFIQAYGAAGKEMGCKKCKKTPYRYGISVADDDSVFSNGKVVTSVTVRGYMDNDTNKDWELSYGFDTCEYNWSLYEYDSVSGKHIKIEKEIKDIPYYECFQNAINNLDALN